MHYKPKHFQVKELVPKHIYEKYGEWSLNFLDAGLLHDLDVIREALGQPIIVNTTHGYNWSGLRTPEYSGYSPTSAHSMGKAIDIKLVGWQSKDFSNGPVQMVMDLIKELKQKGELKYITRMELNTENWVHIDVFNSEENNSSGLYLFG